MKRTDADRLQEIIDAIEIIKSHVTCGDLPELLVFDAVCMRLTQIGEAVRNLRPETKALAPEFPWQDVADMRNHLAHRYFDTSSPIVARAVKFNLPVLDSVARRLLAK